MSEICRCSEHGVFLVEDKKSGDFWNYPLEEQLERFGIPKVIPFLEMGECPYCKKIMVVTKPRGDE